MKKALISVFDKTGIIDFCKQLTTMDWEIISTGGTARQLKENGINVVDISEVTGFPECFDGRVKTLHPKIHGGLLALRDNQSHKDKMAELNIDAIDLVINNLYPFKATMQTPGVSHEEIIENIDIGGPSMLRAAAKNYKYVTVVVDPVDYDTVLNELRENNNQTCEQTRSKLAAKVFQHTAHYDSLIADYFNDKEGIFDPDVISFTYEKKQELRYGENPHQKAAYYTQVHETEGSITAAKQLHGKALSFNNISDANGALETLKEFSEPTVVAVKHANPCGVGTASNIAQAYKKAYEADSISIFGGIIAANRQIDEEAATEIKKIFIEIVIAPSFSKKALEILTTKKNLRILELPEIQRYEYQNPVIKSVIGGLLIQERDAKLLKDELKVVSKRQPNEKEMEDLIFAWKVVKHAKSNGIALAKDKASVGIGPGQTNRIWALQNAIRQGGNKVEGSVMASDAFFPFSDSVEAAGKAGITAIIQPGGSIRDEDSIKMADKFNIAMVFTGMRHFKH